MRNPPIVESGIINIINQTYEKSILTKQLNDSIYSQTCFSDHLY